MAAGSASGLGGSEITGVRVDVEDHVGRIVSNDRVGVGGHVIEESIYSFHCFFCWCCLLRCNLTQRTQYCHVHRPPVIQENTHDLLDTLFASLIEGLAFIRWGEILGRPSEYNGVGDKGSVLFSGGGRMG